MTGSTAATISLVGGVPALDFANTNGDGVERLASVADLFDWAAHSGVIDPGTGLRLKGEFARHQEQAVELLRRAHDTRAVLRILGTTLAHGKPPEPAVLNRLRDAASEVIREAEFKSDGEGRFRLNFARASVATSVLGPVVWSALEMLAEGHLERVKQCPACGFLFFDRSKNNSRRWCDMTSCGNRAKLRNYRERRR